MTMNSFNPSHETKAIRTTEEQKLMSSVSLVTRKKIQLLLLLRFSDDGCLLSKLREEYSSLYNEDLLPGCPLEHLRRAFRDMERYEEPELRLDEKDKDRPFLRAYAVSQREAKEIAQQVYPSETSLDPGLGDQFGVGETFSQLEGLDIDQLLSLGDSFPDFAVDTHTDNNSTLLESSASCTSISSQKSPRESSDSCLQAEELASCVNAVGQRGAATGQADAVHSDGSSSALDAGAEGSILETISAVTSPVSTATTVECDYSQVTDTAVNEDVASSTVSQDIASSAISEDAASSAVSEDAASSAFTQGGSPVLNEDLAPAAIATVVLPAVARVISCSRPLKRVKSRDTRCRKALSKRITDVPSPQEKKIQRLSLNDTVFSRTSSSRHSLPSSISNLNRADRVSKISGYKAFLDDAGPAPEYNDIYDPVSSDEEAPRRSGEDVQLLSVSKRARELEEIPRASTWTFGSQDDECNKLMESCNLSKFLKAKCRRILKPKKNKVVFSNHITSFNFWSCCPSGSSRVAEAVNRTFYIRTTSETSQTVYKWVPREQGGGYWTEVWDLYLPPNTIIFGEILKAESGLRVFNVIDAGRVQGKNIMDLNFDLRKRQWCHQLKKIDRAKCTYFMVTMEDFPISHLSKYLTKLSTYDRVTLSEQEVIVRPSNLTGKIPTVVIKEILFRNSSPPKAATPFKSIMSSMRCWEWNSRLKKEISQELADCRETAVLYELLMKYSKN